MLLHESRLRVPPDAFQRLQDGGVEITGEREAMVGRVSAPAGKDIEIGHEDMRTAAPAHQHAYASSPERSSSMIDAASRGLRAAQACRRPR